jgi:urease accessory protein
MIEAKSFSPHSSYDEKVILTFDQRYRRRCILTTTAGRSFLLNLSETTVLQNGDGLNLSDGTGVEIVAACEDVLDISSPNVLSLLSMAWSLGNRHCPVELRENVLRVRYDPLIESWRPFLHLLVTRNHAPFTPNLPTMKMGVERDD